jgi:hypothetical protein
MDHETAPSANGWSGRSATAPGTTTRTSCPAPPPWNSVAQGRTNAQIAAELYISVRTVGSHLDQIRDKTGCRRRADRTRLALSEGLL